VLFRWFAAAWLVGAVHAQSKLPQVTLEPETQALVELRNEVRRSLTAIPDYSCSQTVARARLTSKARKRMRRALRESGSDETRLRAATDSSDRLGLEVAVVDGRELYAWPGEPFQEQSLSEMVGFGTTSTGDFNSHAESIFVHSQGRIRHVGIEDFEGARARRYDYEVSAFRSGYRVGSESGSAVTAYRGSFWASERDDRLMRLTIEAVDVPIELGIASASTRIDYQTVDIDGEDYLLPAAAQVRMTFLNDSEEINETTFHDCRRFRAESGLSFAIGDREDPGPVRESPTAADPVGIPPGLELQVKLDVEIRSRGSRISESRTGDPIAAVVVADARRGDRVIVAKGARLTGRIRRLERLGAGDESYFAVGLEFDRLQASDAEASVRLRLVRIGAQTVTGEAAVMLNAPSHSKISRSTQWNVLGLNETIELEEESLGSADTLPGIDVFYVHGSSLRLRRGLPMTWRAEENP